MTNDAWVLHLDISSGLSVNHLQEFVALWDLTSHLNLAEGIHDTITWKLTTSGEYSCKSAYLAQFGGLILSPMDSLVWKHWAPPKCKFFAWLILQNRIWTNDRLERRGWPNGKLCPLCRCVDETACHLLLHCRYSIRIWNMIKTWLGLADFDTASWSTFHTVERWWSAVVLNHPMRRKGLASLLMLTAWEIWTERNARTFNNMSTLPAAIFARIKFQAKGWIIAGAKHLGHLLPGD